MSVPAAADSPTTGRPRGGATALSLTIAFSALVGLVTTVIWAATTAAYYWPCWVWLAGLAVVAPFAIPFHVIGLPADAKRLLIGQTDVSLAVAVFLVLIWWFAGADAVFWPLWPLLALATLLAAHAVVAYRHLLPHDARQRELTARVETLTRTRREALDVQTTELRRIERDLHDGAQARLVALSMQLGRAEARLGDDPETAALVRGAREEAGAAIAEMRDLARGIAPPVLADRGLVAAVRSLAERSAAPVSVTADDDQRLPVTVESAAYFVIAEALTNVAKHAPGAAARVALARPGPVLVLDVTDDGPGGADPNGTGLDGLRARVEALDGTFAVVSPAGGPTVIHAELPCGS